MARSGQGVTSETGDGHAGRRCWRQGRAEEAGLGCSHVPGSIPCGGIQGTQTLVRALGMGLRRHRIAKENLKLQGAWLLSCSLCAHGTGVWRPCCSWCQAFVALRAQGHHLEDFQETQGEMEGRYNFILVQKKILVVS